MKSALLLFGILAAAAILPRSQAADDLSAKRAAGKAVSSERIAELVGQLGSDEFAQREAATEQLTKLGLPAYRALEEAAQSPDREVRYRSERILSAIRELDLQRRLEAFLQGKDDGDYPLPAWNRFKKGYGDDNGARALFVDMHKADGELLDVLDKDPKAAAELVTTRVQQHQQAMQLAPQASQLSLGQVMSLLFVAAESDVALQAQSISSIFNFCHQSSVQEAMKGNLRGGVPRKILGGLVERSEDWAAYQAMMLAYQYNMKEGLTPAVKILEGRGNRAPHMAQYALLTVAKMGDESHLPVVQKLFDDKQVLSKMQENNKVVHEVQVRDAALAAAVYLTKQDIKRFFPGMDNQMVVDPQQVFFNARVMGFSDEAKRASAFKIWFAYAATRKAAAKANPSAESAPAAK